MELNDKKIERHIKKLITNNFGFPIMSKSSNISFDFRETIKTGKFGYWPVKGYGKQTGH